VFMGFQNPTHCIIPQFRTWNGRAGQGQMHFLLEFSQAQWPARHVLYWVQFCVQWKLWLALHTWSLKLCRWSSQRELHRLLPHCPPQDSQVTCRVRWSSGCSWLPGCREVIPSL
jgi:hypothetical protein